MVQFDKMPGEYLYNTGACLVPRPLEALRAVVWLRGRCVADAKAPRREAEEDVALHRPPGVFGLALILCVLSGR